MAKSKETAGFPVLRVSSSEALTPAPLARSLVFCSAARAHCSKRQRRGAANTIKIDEAQQEKQYLSFRNDDTSNAATEEAPRLSGVPVSQVQEGLVRDRGAKHRKQAQMARRRILHSTPPSQGRMLKKDKAPPSVKAEDRDAACVSSPLRTMKSNAALPVRPPPGRVST